MKITRGLHKSDQMTLSAYDCIYLLSGGVIDQHAMVIRCSDPRSLTGYEVLKPEDLDDPSDPAQLPLLPDTTEPNRETIPPESPPSPDPTLRRARSAHHRESD